MDGPRFVRKHQPPTRGSCPSFVRGWVVGLVCVLCGRSLSFDCSLGSCEDSNCVGGAVLEAALCVGEAVYAKSCAFSEGGPGWLTERERGELLECSCAAKCEPPRLLNPPPLPPPSPVKFVGSSVRGCSRPGDSSSLCSRNPCSRACGQRVVATCNRRRSGHNYTRQQHLCRASIDWQRPWSSRGNTLIRTIRQLSRRLRASSCSTCRRRATRRAF